MRALSFGLILLAACGSKSDDKTGKPSVAPMPMPITFGDCAGPTVAFEAGPRPLPFTAEQAAAAWAAAQDPPPPPPEADTQPTGTAMALDEGKMGKRDPEDPQLARKQAIEAARAAGILGQVGTQKGGDDDGEVYGGLLGDEAGEMTGGFGYGRAGFGPGGGGNTGWGTIGTGRYGTIGHGAGYGVGGRMQGRTSAVPLVAIGTPNANGDLDKAIIRRYIKRNINKIQYCYEKQLLARPGLAGTVTVSFFITPNGTVSTASAAGVDPEVASCVAAVIKELEFPKPKGGGGVQVNYPFTFRQAGDGPPPPPAPTPAAVPVAPPDASPDAAPHVDPAAHPVASSSYVPGATNPLRGHVDELATCFRAAKPTHGAIVVALTYGAAGTDAVVHGLDDAAARACVAAAARSVVRRSGAPAAERCSLAFGEMPLGELRAIEMDPVIRYNGKAIRDDAEAAFVIAGVLEVVKATPTPAPSASGPVVVSHPPVLLKPVDATPITTVLRVMRTVLAGDSDVLLAARRGTEWKLLAPMSLPTVPVPFGTGGTWARGKTNSRHAAYAAADESPNLSVLAMKDGTLWVGLSRVNEFQQIAAGPDRATKLADALKQHKTSAFFADRVDVELAADDNATYGDLVSLIDAAIAAGFTGWRITSAAGLSAQPTL